MALRGDSSGDYAVRTTGGFYDDPPYTICFWVYREGTVNGSGVFGLRNIVDTQNDDGYCMFYNYNSDGSTYGWEQGGGSYPNLGGFTLSTNTWFFVAISYAGTGANQTNVYRRAASDAALTAATGTFPQLTGGSGLTQEAVLAQNYDFTNTFQGRIAALKQWPAALTEAELLAESHQILPVRFANLHSFRPFVDNTVAGNMVDYSGNGRNLTSNGSLVVADGPPIAWKRGPQRIFIPVAASGVTVESDVTSSGAISTTNSADVTSSAAISRTEQSDAATSAAVSATSTADVTASAALSTTNTADVSSDAATIRTEQTDVTSSAVASRTEQLDVASSAAMSRAEQSDVTTDAHITVAGQTNTDVTSDASVSRTEQGDVTSDAAISQTVQSDVTSSAALSRTEQIDVTSAAATSRTELADVASSSAVSRTEQADISSSASISGGIMSDVDTSTAISRIEQSDVSTDAHISIEGQADLEIPSSAALSIAAALSVSSDAAIDAALPTLIITITAQAVTTVAVSDQAVTICTVSDEVAG